MKNYKVIVPEDNLEKILSNVHSDSSFYCFTNEETESQ